MKKPEKVTDSERVKIVNDKIDDILDAVEKFTRSHVYVGVPESNDARDGEIGNAALAYIHNYGSGHIPPRPFMEPGIAAVQATIEAEFLAGAQAALDGDLRKANARLAAAGFAAVASIKDTIRAGIPPPLQESSVRSRQYARKGKPRASELKYPEMIVHGASAAELMAAATPLVNTGRLINSITFVITHDEY